MFEIMVGVNTKNGIYTFFPRLTIYFLKFCTKLPSFFVMFLRFPV